MMEFRTVSDRAELEKWFDLCDACFVNTPREYFVRHFEMDPFVQPHDIFIALDDGKLVASVRVFRREIYIAGQRVGMGGIGEVCTLPEYREQQLSYKLLRMACAYMEALDLPVSVLFASRHNHYARHGYMLVRQPYGGIDASALPADPAITARIAGPADAPLLRGMYDLDAPSHNGLIARTSDAYWEKWVRAEWKTVVVFEKAGELLGYADMNIGESARVREMCVTPQGREFMPAVLASALPLLGDATKVVMPCALMSEDLQKHAAVLKPGTGYMIRFNTPFALGSRDVATPAALLVHLGTPVFFDCDGF